MPFLTHDDDRNITYPDLQLAATAAGLSVPDVVASIAASVQSISRETGSDPTDAFLQMVHRPTLMFDIDGVLAFWLEATVAILNARFNLSLAIPDMTSYWLQTSLPLEQANWLNAQLQRGLFYYNLAPDFTGIEALNALHRAGYNIVVASDRPADTTRQSTITWLAKWGAPYDVLVLNGRGSKKDYIEAHATPATPYILFDDDPRKAVTIPGANAQVWAPVRPWTPKNWADYDGYFVFDSWDTVLDKLGVSPVVTIPSFTLS